MEQGILDTLYCVLASPSEGLKRVTEGRPIGWAILVAAIISVIGAMTLPPHLPDWAQGILGIGWGGITIVFLTILWVILSLIILLITAEVFHLVARLLGGQGDYLGIVCGLCFATLPVMFFAPLGVLRALLSTPGAFLYLVGTIALFLWVLILAIIAIRCNYNFSTGRAVATYFIPFVVLFFGPLVLLFLFLGVLIG